MRLTCQPRKPPTCRHFAYFIWLNSSGRGPFLPSYYAATTQNASWTSAFTAKLTGWELRNVAAAGGCPTCAACTVAHLHAGAMQQARLSASGAPFRRCD